MDQVYKMIFYQNHAKTRLEHFDSAGTTIVNLSVWYTILNILPNVPTESKIDVTTHQAIRWTKNLKTFLGKNDLLKHFADFFFCCNKF